MQRVKRDNRRALMSRLGKLNQVNRPWPLSRLGDSPGSVRLKTGAIAQTADRKSRKPLLRARTWLNSGHFFSHSRAGGSLLLAVQWIPACAGMTRNFAIKNQNRALYE